ncbi:unnamed protein product [Rotaria sp. Silwood2]|nr:unnamed protein product [Rotaria sp. Silwood2]CAF2468815.1 unnamed protein product [Rotaria sp. Silwood2]CAF4007723.1 unnamed protein product [Rotaria sp. Silwood2]CAF4136825.1 unnamed protein product [Rotaria sp. Silwood2]CAF4434852.1 unnamed protein product [Rotaria sp. Silwood2]
MQNTKCCKTFGTPDIPQSLLHDIFQFNTHATNVIYSKDRKSHWTERFFEYHHIPDNIIDLSTLQDTFMYSNDYRSSEQVRNKRGILVGISMSTTKIAADMATSAKHIIHMAPYTFWSVPHLLPLITNDSSSPFLSHFYFLSSINTNIK